MLFSQKEILERTFDLLASVKRYETYETEWHETKLEWNTVYPNIPCTIQRSTRRNTDQTNSTNEIEYDTVLLHSPDYLLKPGDKVSVTYPNGVKVTFETGEPYYFSTHHETPLVREDEA